VTQVTTTSQIRRPVYREGQLLEAAELQAEQRSRDDALARHQGNVHTPGIITGLQLTAAATGGDLRIQPGLAIDGAGRYLVLDRALTTSLADGEDVTVSIIWRQGAAQIELSDRPPPAQADRAQDAWPVVLGQAAQSAGTVTVSADTREELHLRAATLTPPAGGSRVLLGGQSGRSTQILGVQLSGGAGWADVTTVDADGSCRVSADADLDGELEAGGGRAVLNTAVPAPPAAAPWSLYRTTFTRPDKTVAEQLRLEVGELKSGVDPHALDLFVAQDGTGTVNDLLHVDANGTVTISGSLVVEGVATASGSPNPLPGGTTLAGLAAQEADLLASAQLVLNQLTNMDLRAEHVGVTHSNTVVSYTLRLASSAATAVNAVSAYETVTGPVNVISSGLVAQAIDLPAGSTSDVARSIDVGATGLTVTIAVVAIGVGQDGQPRIGMDSFQAGT
jgi:hypothetical protein